MLESGLVSNSSYRMCACRDRCAATCRFVCTCKEWIADHVSVARKYSYFLFIGTPVIGAFEVGRLLHNWGNGKVFAFEAD